MGEEDITVVSVRQSEVHFEMPIMLSRRSIREFEYQTGFPILIYALMSIDSMGHKCAHIVRKNE